MCKFTNRLFVFTLLASTSSASEVMQQQQQQHPSIMRHGSRFGLLAPTRRDNIVEAAPPHQLFDGSVMQQEDDDGDDLNEPNILVDELNESLAASAFLYLKKLFDQLWWFTLLVDRASAADKHKLLIASEENDHYEANSLTASTDAQDVVKMPSHQKLTKEKIWPKRKLTKGSAGGGGSNTRIKPKLAVSAKNKKEQH